MPIYGLYGVSGLQDADAFGRPLGALGAALGEAADAHAAVCAIMRRAFIAGAPDNVTVVAALPEA